MSLSAWARALAIKHLRQRSMVSLVRLACWIALVGLGVMSLSIINPRPLTVIFAMSLGQVIGIVAFLCYLLSILMDIVRGSEHPPDAPGPARKFSAGESRRDAADSG